MSPSGDAFGMPPTCLLERSTSTRSRPEHLDSIIGLESGGLAAASLAVASAIAVSAILATRSHATRVAVIAPPTSTTSSTVLTHGVWTPCPGTLNVTANTSPDGLPAATSHTDDLAHVQDVMRGNDTLIRNDYPNVVSVEVGPGGGYVWDRTSAGSVVVRHVTNYGIYVHLQSLGACPSGAFLNPSYDGIGLTFVYVAPGGLATVAPTTTVAPTSTTGAPTTTTIPQPAYVPAKPGDVDGDGIPDRVTITWNTSGATVVADLSRLGHQTIPVAVAGFLLSGQGPDQPAILGVVDVDSDGYGEIFVQVDHGASTGFFTIIKLINGRLTQVTLNGQPVHLPFFGSVGHASQVGCGSGHLSETSWSTSDQAQTYQGEQDVYGFSGAQLVLLSQTTHTFVTNGQPPTISQLSVAGYLQKCPPID